MTTTVIIQPLRSIKLPNSLKDELRALLYQVQHEGMDLMFCIDGPEGSGKSQTGRLVGAFCAEVLGTPFGPENVHYGTEEYMRASDSMGRFTVHILDEAGVILHRASANTREARRFTKYLQVAREGNNQVHIVILPAYHILDGYLINWRSKFTMHMYAERIKDDTVPGGIRMRRGAFKLFPRTQELTQCWNLYQDRKVFVYPKQYFIHDRVPNCEVFNAAELEKVRAKKEAWRRAFVEDDAKEGRPTPKQKKALASAIKIMREELGMSIEDVGKRLGYSYEMAQKFSKGES